MKSVEILGITIACARRKMGRFRRAYGNKEKAYPKSGSMDGNKENAYPKSRSMDGNKENAYPKTRSMDKKPGTVYPKPGRMDKKQACLPGKSMILLIVMLNEMQKRNVPV
jgi:hypothetical protein